MASRSLERGCRAVRVLNGCLLGVPVRHLLHEESYRCLAPPRNTTNKEHLKINPNDRQSTKLTDQALGTTERAASLRVKSRNTNQHSNPARLQHSNPYPSSHRPSRVIARVLSANAAQCASHSGEPHYNTDTTRTSRDTQLPPAGGPVVSRDWRTARRVWPV